MALLTTFEEIHFQERFRSAGSVFFYIRGILLTRPVLNQLQLKNVVIRSVEIRIR